MHVKPINMLFRKFLFLGALTVIVAWTLAPFYLIFATSISSDVDLLSVPPKWWPTEPVFYRYRALLVGVTPEMEGRFMPGMVTATRKFRYGVKNSVLVSVCATVVALSFAIPAAYSFARLSFPLRGALLAAMIGSRMVPPVAIIIPLYIIAMKLSLLDNILTLIILNITVALPLMLWILFTYFKALPKSLEEQGLIDGCTRVGVLLKIMLPISLPGIIAAATVGFITVWNEFFYALIFTETTRAETLPKLIAAFSSQYGGMDYGLVCAGGVLAIIPPLLFAILAQRYLISGLTAGAIK